MRAFKIGLKTIFMIAVVTAMVMLLWNWLIPGIFKGPEISYIQALGLLLLSKLLLFLPGRGCHRGSHWRSRHWKELEEKMKGMTDEERAKFKEKLEQRRC